MSWDRRRGQTDESKQMSYQKISILYFFIRRRFATDGRILNVGRHSSLFLGSIQLPEATIACMKERKNPEATISRECSDSIGVAERSRMAYFFYRRESPFGMF